MNLIFLAVIGLISGWITGQIMNMRGSWLRNMFIGMFGAVIGGFIMNALGWAGITGLNIHSIFVAVLGAVIFINILPTKNR